MGMDASHLFNKYYWENIWKTASLQIGRGKLPTGMRRQLKQIRLGSYLHINMLYNLHVNVGTIQLVIPCPCLNVHFPHFQNCFVIPCALNSAICFNLFSFYIGGHKFDFSIINNFSAYSHQPSSYLPNLIILEKLQPISHGHFDWFPDSFCTNI
jgi:hypothetical protein